MYVQVDDEFFKKERNNAYHDWMSSFWRELAQNAIDQDATEIRIGICQNLVSNTTEMTFSDNGPGMSRQTLHDVYFKVGKTTKGGSDQIGGMGRARLLTCFSMPSYLIRSDDYLVLGRGGDYDVLDMPKLSNGCGLVIRADGTNVKAMRQKLFEFLGESRIAAKIIVNDAPYTKAAEHLGQHTRDLSVNGESFAEVYVNKSLASKRAIVRVNGVAMFTTEISAKAQVVINLKPTTSREALTSNRDGLRGEYRTQFNAFIRELAADTQSSLHPRIDRKANITPGGGLKHMLAPNVVHQKPATDQRRPVMDHMVPAAQPYQAEPFYYPVVEDEPAMARDAFEAWLANSFGDIYVHNDSNNDDVLKVVSGYLPKNWKPMIAHGKTFRKGGNIAKVLLMWSTAIRYALEVAMEPLGRKGVVYGVGFVFSDASLAEKRMANEGHIFLINPVDDKGKLIFAVRERMSLKRLMSHAKHEVAHLKESWHDENFSMMREQIDRVFDEAECFRRMKKALDNVPNR